MNIFEGLKEYKKKPEDIPEDLDEYGRDSKGIYRNDFTSLTYSDLCKRAAELNEDLLEY